MHVSATWIFLWFCVVACACARVHVRVRLLLCFCACVFLSLAGVICLCVCVRACVHERNLSCNIFYVCACDMLCTIESM